MSIRVAASHQDKCKLPNMDSDIPPGQRKRPYHPMSSPMPLQGYYLRYILMAASLIHNESKIYTLCVDEAVKKQHESKQAQAIIKMADTLATSHYW